MKTLGTERWLRIILAVSAILYVFLLPRYPIGTYNDDGIYILAAKSLLQGSYAQLNLPHQPPLTLYPPGFPLFLAPFTGLLHSTPIDSLKIVPLILTLGSLILLWILFRKRLPQPYLIALVALYAFNPITAAFSGLLMSEPCFIFALLLLFVWMGKKEESPLTPWVLGALLGWTALIRTDGIVIIPAVGLGLIFARRWRALAIAIPLGLLPSGLFYLRNALASDTATAYQGIWELMAREVGFEGQGILLQNAWNVLSTLGLQNFVSLGIPIDTVHPVMIFLLLILFAGLIGFGVHGFFQKEPDRSGTYMAIMAFCVFYLSIHVLWLAVEVRYGMPLVPFLLAFGIKGAQVLIQRRPLTRWGLYLVGGSLLIFSFVENARALRTARSTRDKTHPAETYRWMTQSLPQDALVLTSGPAIVHLYTGKFTTLEAPARDAEDFRYGLMQRGVKYILVRPLDFYPMALRGPDPNVVWKRRLQWIQSAPSAYRPIYSNLKEGREVFEILDDSRFRNVYSLYLSAIEAFEKGSWPEGFALLDRTLRQNPRLINAYNAYGVGALLSGTRMQEGLTRLRQGHRLSPDNGLILLNLARLEKRMGDPQAASHYAMAAAAIERTHEYTSLLPIIRQESSL